MKRQFYFFIRIYLFFLIIGTVSCITCGGNSPNYYNVESFSSSLLKKVYIDDTFLFEDLEDDEVNYNEYGVLISPLNEYYSTANKSFLVNSMYACDEVPPTTTDKYLDVNVFTNNAFDEDHLEGSDVSDFFKILNFDNNLLTIDDFMQLSPLIEGSLILVLDEKPSASGDFSFTIHITLDGKILNEFELITNSVKINID